MFRRQSLSCHLCLTPPLMSHVARRLFSTSLRFNAQKMAKHEWIVILPDNEGALKRRMDVRPQHLSNLKPQIDSGFWLFGGAFFGSLPKEGESPDIKGSVMLALAESKEEVVEALKKDIYSESDVWNWDKVQIYPFRSAIRSAL